MTLRIAIVDDQELFRAGLGMIIGTQDDMVLAAQAADGRSALDIARSGEVDVMLMDLNMPSMDGIEATSIITSSPNSPSVIVLTTFDEDENVVRAIEAGAGGYLLKDARPELLLSAIRAVGEGTSLVATATTLRLVRERVVGSAPVPSSFTALTQREQDVFRGAARGLNNAEIAEHMGLSETTVKSYLSRTLTKLGLRDRVQLVLFAFRHGLAP
ncbi:Response regulator protein VraR [Microbacterium oxydans]|uniref:Response regulator protein VraR n=1 Tax=Microbacterium oxydans TaxID=82380 RepID=A0A0F0KH82_9MICO|nr:response regulator transcription factor [Microbacterium oxydans]KJL18656.1 Response regulator protein VraR [Microbacterium oxydans]